MRSLKICALTALLSTPLAAQAANPSLDDIDDRIARAEAVMEGTVQSVRFVDSQPEGGRPGLPHTLVTYSVDRVFKGRVAGGTVTLRFFGGLDATGDALVITSNGIQHDPGDRDILMLAGNGVAECPVVDCTHGRFRLIDGEAYDDAGRAMVMDATGAIRRGSAYDLRDVNVWETVGLVRVGDPDDTGEVLAEVHAEHGPAGPQHAPIIMRTRIERTPPVSADVFRDVIASRVRTQQDPTRPPVVVRSVDPEAAFVYVQPDEVRPIGPADGDASAAGPR